MFFCGAVSHCKSLQTNALETVWIMVKGGKCQFTMDQTDLTISRSHLLLRKSEVGISLSCLKILPSEFLSFSLFVRTQLPHAVGAAYSLKMDKKDACAITYFGDGGTSEVDEKSPTTKQLLASNILSSFPDRLKCSGRLPCCAQLCSCYGGTSGLLLPQQWLGNQHPNH